MATAYPAAYLKSSTSCCCKDSSNQCEPIKIVGQTSIPYIGDEVVVMIIGSHFNFHIVDAIRLTGLVRYDLLTDNIIAITWKPLFENSLLVIPGACGDDRIAIKAQKKPDVGTPTGDGECECIDYFAQLYSHKPNWGATISQKWSIIFNKSRSDTNKIIPIKGKDELGSENWQILQVTETAWYRITAKDLITTNEVTEGWISVLVNDVPVWSEPIDFKGQISINVRLILQTNDKVRLRIQTMEDVQRKLYMSFPRKIEGTNIQFYPETGMLGGFFMIEYLKPIDNNKTTNTIQRLSEPITEATEQASKWNWLDFLKSLRFF